MNQQLEISPDEHRLVRLFRCLSEEGQDDLLRSMSEQLISNDYEAAGGTVEEPEDDVVEEQLLFAMPPREPWDYLDEYIYRTLESAWPEGLAETLLGVSTYDVHWARELLEATQETAAECLPEPSWFSVDDMLKFLRVWREAVVKSLETRHLQSHPAVPASKTTYVTADDMHQHGPWRILRSDEVHRDPWTAVRHDQVIRPDGKPGTYTVVHLKPGVCVLAIDDEYNVYLTEGFHYGVGRTTIEAVSGGVERGEDALLTAQGELQEELGIEAAEWSEMGLVDPFTANVVSPTRLYLAQGLRFGEHAQEGTEQIRCVKTPLDEAVRMVSESEITHGPSCVLILKASMRLSGAGDRRGEL